MGLNTSREAFLLFVFDVEDDALAVRGLRSSSPMGDAEGGDVDPGNGDLCSCLEDGDLDSGIGGVSGF